MISSCVHVITALPWWVQVLYGVPQGKEEEARALTAGIKKGLQGVLGAIDAK